MTVALPAEYTWGFVTGKIIHARGDQAPDADRLPEASAATGSVKFTPMTRTRRASDALVIHEVVSCGIGPDGIITDAENQPGVWLFEGAYRVEFTLGDGGSYPAFDIAVTAAHTIESPLDLATAAPYVPPTGTTATVMLVPSGAYADALLAWGDDGLEWQPNPTASIPAAVADYLTANPPSGSPDATTLAKGIVRLAGDLGGTADAPTVPGLADKAAAIHTHDDRYYTEAETDALLGGKAAAIHEHTVADVTGLQGALDGKQPAGSYAAATHNHAGTYAPALGPDDNYVTDAEKAALHTHPAVIAQGEDAAAARAAIGAGTSSLTLGTTADTAKAGDYAPDLSGLLTTAAAPELIRDTMGAALVAGANITITPNDAGDTITIAGAAGGSGIAATIMDAKGDLIVGTAADTAGRLPAGTTGQALVVDPGTATGLAWAAAPSSAYELRGTGMPNGAVTAAVGTYYTDTISTNGATRWYKASGTGNTGWIIVFGDTGWRDVTTLTAEPTAFNMWIRRVGSEVIGYLSVVATPTGSTVLVLPTGFEAKGNPWGGAHASACPVGAIGRMDGPQTILYLGPEFSPTTLMTAGITAVSRRGYVRWTTPNAWPTSLPGTPG